LLAVSIGLGAWVPSARAEEQTASPQESAVDEHDDNGVAQRVFGWSAVGIGAAAVIAGAVIGTLALVRYEELDCPEQRCPPDRADDVAAYNDLRVPSGLAIFGGVLALGAGISFLAFDDFGSKTAVVPVVGPGSVGIVGRF
jgi:hypothetical protein